MQKTYLVQILGVYQTRVHFIGKCDGINGYLTEKKGSSTASMKENNAKQ